MLARPYGPCPIKMMVFMPLHHSNCAIYLDQEENIQCSTCVFVRIVVVYAHIDGELLALKGLSQYIIRVEVSEFLCTCGTR